MDDFLKQFRDNLEGRPEPGFDKRDWKSLEKRLGFQPVKSRGAFFWWWFAAPVMLLSIASNVLLFNTLETTKKKVSLLEMRRDTVFFTKIVQQTDTVFQTKTDRETVVRYLPATFSGSVESHAHGISISAGTATMSPLTTGLVTGDSKQSKADHPAKNQVTTKNFEAIALPRETLTSPRIAIHPLTVPDRLLRQKSRKTIRHSLYSMRPKDFQLTAGGGLAFPFSKGLERKSGYSYSLEASTGLSPALRLWGEATWYNISFLSDHMGQDVGAPVVPAPNDDFEFIQAETSQPMLQYAAGMLFYFRTEKRWQPFLGLGYGAVSTFPYEVSYEFIDPVAGTEWNFDHRVDHRTLLTDFLLLRAGAEVRLTGRWHGQLGTVYRFKLGENNFSSPRIFGLQCGLKFGF